MGKFNEKYDDNLSNYFTHTNTHTHTSFNEFLSFSECWDIDSHKRPKFKIILRDLEIIAESGFKQTPHESFHNMQDGWKKEIAEVLHELRLKEKVSYNQALI